MRVLATTTEHMPPGRTAVRIALAAGEELNLAIGEPFPGSGHWEGGGFFLRDQGPWRVAVIRYTDAPEPALRPGERVYALEVEAQR